MIPEISPVCCRIEYTHIMKAHAEGRVRPYWCGGPISRSLWPISLWRKCHTLYTELHTHTVLPVYIITCEKHQVAFAHAPPIFILSRVSYRIFAPSRARRLAGLKRRTTDNKPRNSCPANATGRYLFTRCIEVNVYPIRVDDTKVSHAHVRESCNVLMHPAIFFSFFQSFLAVASRIRSTRE